jgi:hypothetical protein
MNAECTVFDNGNEMIDLYKMHVVESFVENVKCETRNMQMHVTCYEVVDDKNVNVNELKCTWMKSFYESGQFVKLILYVCDLLHKETSSHVVVICLNKAVKLLFTFFSFMLNNNNECTNIITEQHLSLLVNELISFIVNVLKLNSTATIYADKINLISSNGDPYIGISDKEDLLNDSTLEKFLKTGHEVVYGDKLCELLSEFIKVFKDHTHNYNNLPVVHDPNYTQFITKYGVDGKYLKDMLLSKNIKVN